MAKLLQKLAEIRRDGQVFQGEYQDIQICEWTGLKLVNEKVFRPIHRPSQVWAKRGGQIEVFESVESFKQARTDMFWAAFRTQQQIGAVKAEAARQAAFEAEQREIIAQYCTDTPTVAPDARYLKGNKGGWMTVKTVTGETNVRTSPAAKLAAAFGAKLSK